MTNQTRQLKVLPITFELYAYDEEEIEEARQAIITFIQQHRSAGRAVTARKVAEAIPRWNSNILVRNEVIKYFS